MFDLLTIIHKCFAFWFFLFVSGKMWIVIRPYCNLWCLYFCHWRLHYIWLAETLDIVASSTFYMCDVNRTYNNILKILSCNWFSFPAFHLSRNRLDNKKIFFIPKEKLYFYQSPASSYCRYTKKSWLLGELCFYSGYELGLGTPITPKSQLYKPNIKIPQIFLIQIYFYITITLDIN